MSLKAIRKNHRKQSDEFKRIEKSITSNTLKKEKLLDLLLSDTIDEDIYHLKMIKLTTEALDLEEKLVKLKSQSNNDTIFSHDRLIKEITEIKSFDIINRNVLQKFVDKIIVSDDGKFEIEYNFKI